MYYSNNYSSTNAAQSILFKGEFSKPKKAGSSDQVILQSRQIGVLDFCFVRSIFSSILVSWQQRIKTDLLQLRQAIFIKHAANNGFPGGSDVKESARNAGDLGSIPGLGRSPGRGHRDGLQYSCLETPQEQRNLAGYTVWGHKESNITE